MHVGRLINQTFGQQRVQAAFDIYNVRPLKFKVKAEVDPVLGCCRCVEALSYPLFG